MVFVRVHLMKERLNTAQKEELGAKLVQAVSEVENLVNNHTHKETSWVQFYELDPENWWRSASATFSAASASTRGAPRPRRWSPARDRPTRRAAVRSTAS